MKSYYKYSIFGFTVDSEIEFPEMTVSSGIPEATIRYGALPQSLGNHSYKGVCFEAIPGKLLLKAINVARYLISDGNEILIEPSPQAEESNIRLFLLSSAIGALLHQRGILSLHSNAISINNNAFLLAGISGTGKSTLAAMLASKGFSPLTDDITAIGYSNDTPVIFPGIPQLKLWHDAIAKMNLREEGLTRVRKELEKFYYPINAGLNYSAVPLRKIYIMNISNQDEIEIKPLSGIEKFTVLKNHTYRYNFIKSMNMEEVHFKLSSKLASQIKISRLLRGKKGFELEKLAETVIQDFNQTLNGR